MSRVGEQRCAICCEVQVTTFTVSSGIACCGRCFNRSPSPILPLPFAVLGIEPWQVFDKLRGEY